MEYTDQHYRLIVMFIAAHDCNLVTLSDRYLPKTLLLLTPFIIVYMTTIGKTCQLRVKIKMYKYVIFDYSKCNISRELKSCRLAIYHQSIAINSHKSIHSTIHS